MFRDLEDRFKRILDEDWQSQEQFLDALKHIRYADVEYLRKIGCFFVPNQDYLEYYIGPRCYNPEYDLYNYNGECKWLGHYVFPIRGAQDDLVALVGFNPLSKKIMEDNINSGLPNDAPPKYIVSNKNVFDRSGYLFIPNGYRKMIEDNYVIVVDGVFDAVTPASMGFNTACMLGSDVNDKMLFILSMVDRIYVARDNDDAGLRLYNSIKRFIPRAMPLTQSKSKDLDGYIREVGVDIAYKSIKSGISSEIYIPVRL